MDAFVEQLAQSACESAGPTAELLSRRPGILGEVGGGEPARSWLAMAGVLEAAAGAHICRSATSAADITGSAGASWMLPLRSRERVGALLVDDATTGHEGRFDADDRPSRPVRVRLKVGGDGL